MKGDSTTNSNGIYGTQGTSAATNKPGAREEVFRGKMPPVIYGSLVDTLPVMNSMICGNMNLPLINGHG